MNSETRFKWIQTLISGTLLGIVSFHMFYTRGNYIPKIDEAQSGYAIPGKLEIKVKDLDENGKDETILKYDGKSYLLRVDENNKPSIAGYDIKPIEIITKTLDAKVSDK